jgi:glycosyltransferase involved in cell wall biosynthesis
LRLVVVSPFLDRQHGTEICVIEQIERLALLPGWEIHLYSQRVEDVRGLQSAAPDTENSQRAILWHKVTASAGPHLLKYLWWFLANQWQRRRDRIQGKADAAIVYSPGVNCLDADVIVVHIVFHEFYDRVRKELRLGRTPLRNLPRVIHRRLYYKLIVGLEQRVYRNPNVRLIAVSQSLARHLETHFGRTDVTVIPNAVDTEKFSESERMARRAVSRESLHFVEGEFVVLLIGNDWKNKGLETLIKACAQLSQIPLRLLVVGSDDPALFRPVLEEFDMQDRVQFEIPSRDVMRFYAAADLYAGPSLEDSFGLPVMEAMACGLPVIASSHAGVSEAIRDGETGYILRDPQDHNRLAQLIRGICAERELGRTVGEAACRSLAGNFDWEQNVTKTRQVLEEAASERK